MLPGMPIGEIHRKYNFEDGDVQSLKTFLSTIRDPSSWAVLSLLRIDETALVDLIIETARRLKEQVKIVKLETGFAPLYHGFWYTEEPAADLNLVYSVLTERAHRRFKDWWDPEFYPHSCVHSMIYYCQDYKDDWGPYVAAWQLQSQNE